MLHLRPYYDNLWRWKCGLPEKDSIKVEEKVSVDELRTSEWSPEFEGLMRRRLIFGAYRYGKMGHGDIPEGKPKYDRIKSVRERLKRYEETGNAEWLVDIANMALLMFEEQSHPDHNFTHIDGDTEDSYHDEILNK